jgi:hypothetical protein
MPSKDERLVLLGFDPIEPKQSLLWKGLSRFAKTGWKHDDLKWRHVGVRRNAKSGPLDVFLIDFGSVSVLSQDNVLTWVRQSYNDLKCSC